MDSVISRYWPFDVGDRERHTDQEKREVTFLESAFSRGYQPFEMGLGMGSYGATGNGGRAADIFYRGRGGWELAVYEPDERIVNAFVNDFECAAQAALDWLGGCDDAAVVERVEAHLVRLPGLTPGNELVVRSKPAASHQRAR